MALPPVGREEFLKRLGIIGATRSTSAVNSAGANTKTPVDALQGLIDQKKSSEPQGLGAKILSTAFKPLVVLDTPRRAIISGIREVVDTLDSDSTTNANWGDFKKQTMDASYGFGTAFPMKGFMGKVIGFAGDVLFDPLTYATLGSTVAKKAVTSSGELTRVALGGVKNVSGRQGRAALAKLSKERLTDMASKGVKFADGEIDTIVRDIYAQGKKAMPGYLKTDIGIKGPGIYYLGSRVKVKGSGAIGDFLERKLISTRLTLVSPKSKLNPGQYIHRAITPDGTFLLARVEPEKILEYRVGLANGTLSPKEANMAAGVLEQHDAQRLMGAKALEKVTQGANDVVADPGMESNKFGIHNLIETGGVLDSTDKRFFLFEKTKKFFIDFGLDIKDDFDRLPTGAVPQRLRDNYVPHMESDTTIVNKAKVGEDEWAGSVGEVRITDSGRNASSFRGRKYKKGDLFFGHTLDADKTIDELNYMARNPGDEINPVTGGKFKAIDYDYYETNMIEIINKYARHYSQQKGYAAWLRTGLAKGESYMRAVEREIPLGAEYAMARSKELPKKIATVGPIIDDITTSLSPTVRAAATPPLAPLVVEPHVDMYKRLLEKIGRIKSEGGIPISGGGFVADVTDMNPIAIRRKALNELSQETGLGLAELDRILSVNKTYVYESILDEATDNRNVVRVFNGKSVTIKEILAENPGKSFDELIAINKQEQVALMRGTGTPESVVSSQPIPTEKLNIAPVVTKGKNLAATPEAILVSRELLTATQTKVNELGRILNEAADDWESIPDSFQSLLNTHQELSDRLTTQMSDNYIERLVEDVGPNTDFIEKFSQDMGKFNRDIQAVLAMGEYAIKPEISQVRFPTWYNQNSAGFTSVGLLVNGDVKSVNQLDNTLKNLKNRIVSKLSDVRKNRFIQEVTDAPRRVIGVAGSEDKALRLRELAVKNFRARLTGQSPISLRWRAATEAVEKAQEVGVLASRNQRGGSGLNKTVYSVDDLLNMDDFQYVDSIVPPQTRAERTVKAGFEIENTIHYSESLVEVEEVLAAIQKNNFGGTVGDDYINEVLQRNAQPFIRSTTTAQKQTQEQIMNLQTLKAGGIEGFDVSVVSKQIDEIMGGKNVVSDFLENNFKLNPFIQNVEGDIVLTRNINDTQLISLKDSDSVKNVKNLTVQDINRFLTLHLGGGLDDGILGAKLKLYSNRIDELSNPKFNKEIVEDLFPIHTEQTVKQLNVKVNESPAIVAHAQAVKTGPTRNVTTKRQLELDGLPKTLKDEFVTYIGEQRKRAAEFRKRISEQVVPKARLAEKELSDFQIQHQAASAAWIEDVLAVPNFNHGKNVLSIKESLQNRVKKYFPKAVGFFDSFAEENKNTFNFIAEIEQARKTGVMSDWDFHIGVSILGKNYPKHFRKGKIDKIFDKFLTGSTSAGVTYEEFVDITRYTLGVKFFDDIDNAVMPTLLDLQSRVAAQHDYILRLTSRAVVSEQEVLNATPNNVLQRNRNRLAPFIGNETGFDESTSMLNIRNKQNELEQSDFYPFAKSREKRANTLLALKDFDGEKIDWTLGGRTQLIFDRQPITMTEQRWSALINTNDLSSMPGDEIDYILSWIKQDDVKQIVLGDDFAKSGSSISDEQMLDKFVSYVYKNQPDALTSDARKAVRNSSIVNAWNKSDANKVLTEISRLKKLVTDDLAKKQANNPVRAIDSMLSESDNIVARRTAEGVRADEWVNAYGVDTSKEVAQLIKMRQELEDRLLDEFEPFTAQTRPTKFVSKLDREVKPVAKLSGGRISDSVQQSTNVDSRYVDLLKLGIPREILDGDLSGLNNWMLQNVQESSGLIAKTKLKADFVDNLLVATGDELAQRSEKQLFQEIEILESLRINKIDTPKTEGKINRMIRERRRILDTRSPAEKEAALAQVKKDIEKARIEGTDMLPGSREQVERMVNPPADTEYIGADMIGRPGDKFFDDSTGRSIQEEMSGNPARIIEDDDEFSEVGMSMLSSEQLPASTGRTQRRLPTVEPRYETSLRQSNIDEISNKTPANPLDPKAVDLRLLDVQYNPNVSYVEQFANNRPITAIVPETQIPIVINKNISETLSEMLGLPTPVKIAGAPSENIVDNVLKNKFESTFTDIDNVLNEAKLNAATKTTNAKLAVDSSTVDTAALEQIENSKEVVRNMKGTATPVEQIIIDVGVKQAEILDTVSKLPIEEVEARLMNGLSGMGEPMRMMRPDGSIMEIPFPETGALIKSTLADGWVKLSSQFPDIQVTPEFKTIWDNAKYFEDPVFVKALTQYLGGFTKFHKAYATLTPGFHIRNMIGNTFQYVLAGGKLEHLKPATKIHFDWLAAYKEGKTWKEFLISLDPADAEAATIGRNAMLGSGGGIYGDVFHEVVRGNKIYDNRLTRFSKKYGQMSDNMSRFVLGFDSAKQGMNSDMATARVRKFYFDYEDLSKLDRMAKQFIPFWIWSSRNLPLQLENMWLNPKPYALYNTIKRNIRDKESEERSPLPKFLQEVEAFKLPGVGAYAAPDLNFTRIQQQLSQIVNPKKFGTNLNPLFRVPIEQVIKQNLYNDEPIETANDRLMNALQGLVVPVATGDRLLNSYGDAKINAWLGVFGVPVRKIKEKE